MLKSIVNLDYFMRDLKMTRPSFEPTEEHFSWVKQMVKDGATKKYMYTAMELDFKTFNKYFSKFVEDVKKEGRKKIAKAVSELAESGDAKAAIFLLQQSKKEDFSFYELEGDDDDPMEFLTKVYKRDDVPMELRMKAAQSLLPYKTAKVGAIGVKEGKAEKAKQAAKGGKFGNLDAQLGEGRA